MYASRNLSNNYLVSVDFITKEVDFAGTDGNLGRVNPLQALEELYLAENTIDTLDVGPDNKYNTFDTLPTLNIL